MLLCSCKFFYKKCFYKKEVQVINHIKAVVKKIKALYVRVSTDSQVEGYSIEAQIEFLESYLKSQGWDDYEVYMDPGFSGKNLERPAIQKLIKDCESGKIDMVLVFKLDRLSRSQKDTLFLIEEVFNKNNVGFISIRERFDTTSPFGKAMIGILSVFAQLERETILERTRIGLKKRAEDGFWRGGGKTPFAYDYDKETGTLVVNQERKIIFDLMKTLRLQGYSYHELSKVTGYDEAWIQGILNAKTNLGKIPYKGELYEGRHEAIISEEEYEQLQIIEKSRSRNQHASHYLLSGKIYCAKCGAKYRYQKWGQRIICYCYSQQKSKPKLVKDPNCNNLRLDSFEIEDAFLEQLFAMSLDENLFRETFHLSKTNLEDELKIRLDKTVKKIENLIQLLSEDIAKTEIKIELEKLIEEKTNITKELEDIKEKEQTKKSYEEIKNLSKVWTHLEFKEKRCVIEGLLDKIVVDGNTLKIYWNVSEN